MKNLYEEFTCNYINLQNIYTLNLCNKWKKNLNLNEKPKKEKYILNMTTVELYKLKKMHYWVTVYSPKLIDYNLPLILHFFVFQDYSGNFGPRASSVFPTNGLHNLVMLILVFVTNHWHCNVSKFHFWF